MEQFLSRVEPFRRISSADRGRLAAVAREKRYAKGETIFRTGEPADAVCIVKEGRVHLMKFLEGGQSSTTCVMTPGETFCCLPALDGKPYPVDAVAAVDSTVVSIPTSVFHELLRKSPTFLQDSLCLFCDRLRQMEDKSCMAYDSVERRLAKALLMLSKKFGQTIPLTKQELAELANTTQETTIRILSQLSRKGVIRSARGKTTVLRPEKLSALLDRP